MPVASPSEVEETKGEYDEFAKALIEEVKQAVLEDKDAAKEQIKVAKIVQYSIGSLGKIHYLTEIDGYTVEVFAAQDAFGGFKPKLEVKRLYKPEENEGNGDVPTDAQIAELKANGIENILALRGDLNPDIPPVNEFAHASDLVKFISVYGGFNVIGACYPETHPEAANTVEDIKHLKEKVSK